MKQQTYRSTSFLISVAFHSAVFVLLFFWRMTANSAPVQNYVEIGFGMPGGSGGGGGEFEQIKTTDAKTKTDAPSIAANEVKPKVKPEDVSKVEQPKLKSKDAEKIVTATGKEKVAQNSSDSKRHGESSIDRAKSPAGFGTNPNGSGIGNGKGYGKGNGNGEGDGNGDGYGIDWGGRGIRKVYSYIIPKYPEGVYKEADVKLRFTILPDGTVGNIITLVKADARLESSAVRSLRQWRFEPLPGGQRFVQTAIIVFPYRLR
ncbi:MAG: TonB family protein [Bacteroidota bacterium]|nr:TonB family protein [Bacteroidota bacterium]MDP4195830.1 TonB family protein [Bacteroidota bacterium]